MDIHYVMPGPAGLNLALRVMETLTAGCLCFGTCQAGSPRPVQG